jgi:hypothetical protein
MPVTGNLSDDTQHRHKIVMLDGGLDLVTPPLFVEPGRLIDCLNYECVDKVGYKKIDGFERYDGGASPSANAPWVAYISGGTAATLATDGFYAGATAYIWASDDTAIPHIPITITRVYDRNPSADPAIEFTQADDYDLADLLATYLNPKLLLILNSGRDTFVSVEYDVDNEYQIIAGGTLAGGISSADTVRAEVDALPLNARAYGLQYYKDRVFAVADCRYIYLAFDTTSTVTVPTTDHYFQVGSNLTAGTYDAEILDWRWLRGNFEDLGTNAATRAWAKVLVRPTDASGTFAEADDCFLDTTGTGVSATNYWSAYSTLTGVTSAPTDDEPVWGGVLYKSLEESSARTTGNDWTQVNMGYEVHFTGGNSTVIPRELTLSTTQAQLDEEGETVTSPPTKSLTDSFVNISGAYINNAASANFPGGAEPNDQEALDSSLYTLDTDDNSGVYATYDGTNVGWGDRTGIVFKNFGLSIPEGAIVRRVRFVGKVWLKSASPILAVPFSSVTLVGVDGATTLSFPVTVPSIQPRRVPRTI